MPIKLPKDLPAFAKLKEKKIFVMSNERAEAQDIRPLKIGLLNLMPTKETTETQIFRMIGSSPLQIEPILIQTETYSPKNVEKSHLEKFYTTFSEIQKRGLDGLIITGAPVEQMEFSDVLYWKELTEIRDWADKHICSTLYLCWAAQAKLYHHYGIQKHNTRQKVFGVFPHTHSKDCGFLLRGMDDEFFAPHSRHTEIRKKDVEKVDDLEILAESAQAGIYMLANKNRSSVLITGHPEYDRETLAIEYFRDKDKGLEINLPKNYFPFDDINQNPKLTWRANAETFYRNWINFVYQTTDFDIKGWRMSCGS